MRRKAFAVALAMLVATSMVATPVAAALAFSGDAPNPEISADTTVQSYEASWGNSLQYEDDSGNVQSLPATLNQSNDVDDIGTGAVNPFSFVATDVAVDEFGEFPRKDDEDGDNSASALDASEYTQSGTNTSKLSVSDATTAPGVDAVRIHTDGSMGSGDDATAEYGNFSISSDEDKRYVQLAADIDTLDAGTVVEVRVVDEDGDYKTVEINSSANQADAHVLANQTGEGHVSQQQLGDLTTEGTGDGSFNNIQRIDVVVLDGDVDASFSLINAEKMGTYDFGEKRVDTDDDDDFETKDHVEPHGEISIHSIDTLGPSFDDATITSLTFPVNYQASDLSDSDISTDFGETDSYPGFDIVADLFYRMELPDAYDLSHANAELVTTTNWPGERYVTVEMKEDAGDTDFEDIENWNDITSTHDSQDKDVTLDSTISVGTEYALHYELKLTDDEASAMEVSDGGGGGFLGGGSGGLLGFITSLPGMLLTGVTGFLGGRKLGVF